MSSAPRPAAAVELDPQRIALFAERGFALIPDLLGAAEIDYYGTAVDRAVASRMRFDTRSLAQKTRYEQSFQQCINLWEDHAPVRALSFHARIAATAAQLLGVNAVRLWHDQALYKEAGGRVTDPHQDLPYWAIREPLAVSAWIAFQDVDSRNGAMSYLPGSHRSGLRKFANIFSGDGLDVERYPELAGNEYQSLDVPAGSVAFHHGLTVHRAGANTSSQTRRVHTMIFFADGCTRSDQPHPSVDRARIAVGETIQSDVTPIAWPRPDNDLPAPPAAPDPAIPGWPGWRPRKSSNS